MIQFPGLHLSMNVQPIAFSLFGVPIYWYAICIVVAISVAVLGCYHAKTKFEIADSFFLETLLYAIVFGSIGARLYYVVFQLPYYLQNPVNMLKIRDGGMAIFGAIIVGAMVILWRCHQKNYNFLDFFDRLAPFVALGQAIGRWGNFFNQEAYGSVTTNLFRMGLDTPGGYLEVHPTFLYESIFTCFIFVILRKMQKNRRFKGEIAAWYLVLYGGIRSLIEGLRVDSLMFLNFRISQVLSIAIFVVFGLILLKKYRKYRMLEKGKKNC